MADGARPSLTDLPKGYEFDVGEIEISEARVARYLDAVDDKNACYAETGLVSPVAVAALALTHLLEMLELPFGTLHIGQEIEAHGGVELGAKLAMRGSIAQRSVRAGAVISVIEFSLALHGAASAALTGRTTVMVQAV